MPVVNDNNADPNQNYMATCIRICFLLVKSICTGQESYTFIHFTFAFRC